MDTVTLRQYETLSPFEIKNDLAKVASEDRQGLAGRVPERRPRQPELDRDRAARGVLPARPVRDHREPAHDGPAAPASAACRKRPASPRASTRWLAGARRHARRRRSCSTSMPWAVKTVRLRRRTPSCTSWSTRSSATTIRCPIACSCTTSRSCASTCSGRCAASRGRRARSTCTRSKAARRRCATSSSR